MTVAAAEHADATGNAYGPFTMQLWASGNTGHQLATSKLVTIL